jgi:hypothetical protein
VVSSAVRGPFLWITVLVATVVAWIASVRSLPVMPSSLVSSSTPRSTAIDGSAGVVNSLRISSRPERSSYSAKSVNVPPTSMPSRYPMRSPAEFSGVFTK